MRKQSNHLKERYEQELEQVKTLSLDTIRAKLDKKKVSLLASFDKNSFHFMLNSLLVRSLLFSKEMYFHRTS